MKLGYHWHSSLICCVQVTPCLRKAQLCIGQCSKKTVVNVSEQWVLGQYFLPSFISDNCLNHMCCDALYSLSVIFSHN